MHCNDEKVLKGTFTKHQYYQFKSMMMNTKATCIIVDKNSI